MAGLTRGDLGFLILPFVVAFALGFAFFAVYRRHGTGRRPWWGNPWLWLAVCAAFIVLGVVVWPGLFGGVFVFLPFLWVGRPRAGPQVDPRSNGHARPDGQRR